MAAPSMKERQACWGARDEYWKCSDENTEDASQCKKLRSSFESSCPQQWIIDQLRWFYLNIRLKRAEY
ncbi:cytochrome c oxidase assembly factor 6 homolog [Eubalaena glacialis]|uniref:cytochrome c oxidase assembly factor 6 homolog n=1 Tax=Eubalaena glacialis TaxID=27606 RepID=UPI002A5A4D0A|nr:cytochrome c oxidase assembly factor 6 homolog [Eubalaena glacialis]